MNHDVDNVYTPVNIFEYERLLIEFNFPMEEIPFESYIQSPIGLVPKHEIGQTRLIFHLSYHENASPNFHTPKEKCTVKYKDLDHAIKLCLEARKGYYLAKSDLKSAFPHLPIRKQDWNLLFMMVTHPITKKNYFFFDKNTPFGSSISCANFQQFSDSLECIFCSETNSKIDPEPV